MPTIIEEYTIEDRWDCSACKTINLGRDKKCCKCGKFLTTETFYAPPDTSSANQVTDEVLLAQARKGPDYICRHDGSHQISGNGECATCGAGEKIARGQEGLSDQKPPPEIQTQPIQNNETIVSRSITYDNKLQSNNGSGRNPVTLLLVGLVGALGLSGFIWFLVWLFTPKYLDGTVNDVYFQHTIHIEKQVTDSGFDPDSGAFDIVAQGERLHHHNEVPDGVKKEPCKKEIQDPPKCITTPIEVKDGECVTQENGFRKCTKITTGGDQQCTPQSHFVDDICEYPKVKLVPVNKMWYTWREWEYDRSASVSGHTNETFWPSEEEISLKAEERLGGRDTNYRVTFINQDHSWNYTPGSLQEFKQLKPGTVKHLKIVLGMVTVVPTVQP